MKRLVITATTLLAMIYASSSFSFNLKEATKSVLGNGSSDEELQQEKVASSSSQPSDMDLLYAARAGGSLMGNYLASLLLVNAAQIKLASALELKELAEELKAEKEYLESGSVVKKQQLKKSTAVSKRASEQIEEKASKTKKLNKEQRKDFAIGTAAYSGGIWKLKKLIDLVSEMNNQEKLKNARKIVFITKTGKPYLTSLKDTSIVLGKVAKVNGISIPKGVDTVEDVFPEADDI